VRRSVLIAVVCLAGVASQPAAAAVSSEVAGLQVALYRYGKYKGSIDGVAGPQTK
jgi:peptidoglycan hydrolase-like protein with peptidoglycan-binding domain